MVSRRAWETYPRRYRAREIGALADWMRAGESCSVVGLAGAGKSNLFGFMCHQSHIVAERYLHDFTPKTAMILVDLNNLPGGDLSTFFRVMLRSISEARVQLMHLDESLPETVQALYRKVEEKTDPFVSQSALRDVLLAFREQGMRLVLVLDPFDRFCQDASTQVLDNLRGLRDSFKATLSYVVGLRYELAYLRDPIELGELYEILDTHVCWLGPMEKADARWVIGQVEESTGQSFDDEQAEQLIVLTGGYPALLRAASLWLAQVATTPSTTDWEKCLLDETTVRNRLQELWQGLTSEEQATLSILQTALSTEAEPERQRSIEQIEVKHQQVLTQLQQKHLCATTATGWEIFGRLFERFVAGERGFNTGRIRLDVKAGLFSRGESELSGLSGQDRRLLQHFLAHPRAVHTIDDLIDAAWAEYESGGVSNAAVQQAIRHLRTTIEPNPAKPRYLVTQHGVGYRFFPEGAPQK
jgi:hypothetical protein